MLKYLIKSSTESRKDTEKKLDQSVIQLKYYADNHSISFSTELQIKIQSSMNHIINNIIIDSIMSDENNSSDEEIRNCIKNQLDVFEKAIMTNFTNILRLMLIDKVSQHALINKLCITECNINFSKR